MTRQVPIAGGADGVVGPSWTAASGPQLGTTDERTRRGRWCGGHTVGVAGAAEPAGSPGAADTVVTTVAADTVAADTVALTVGAKAVVVTLAADAVGVTGAAGTVPTDTGPETGRRTPARTRDGGAPVRRTPARPPLRRSPSRSPSPDRPAPTTRAQYRSPSCLPEQRCRTTRPRARGTYSSRMSRRRVAVVAGVAALVAAPVAVWQRPPPDFSGGGAGFTTAHLGTTYVCGDVLSLDPDERPVEMVRARPLGIPSDAAAVRLLATTKESELFPAGALALRRAPEYGDPGIRRPADVLLGDERPGRRVRVQLAVTPRRLGRVSLSSIEVTYRTRRWLPASTTTVPSGCTINVTGVGPDPNVAG